VASRRPAGASQLDGFSGDHRRGGLAYVHGVGVHHPGHHLLAGAHIRRGDIALRAQPVEQFRSVASCETLEFAARHFARVANHPAFGSAEGNIDHRALPSHPGGQRAHFVEGDIGGKANSALARATHRGVQDTIADEHFQLTVVEAHGNVQRDFFARILKITVKALLQSQLVGGHFKARLSILVDVHLFRCGRWRHSNVSYQTATRPLRRSFTVRPEMENSERN